MIKKKKSNSLEGTFLKGVLQKIMLMFVVESSEDKIKDLEIRIRELEVQELIEGASKIIIVSIISGIISESRR